MSATTTTACQLCGSRRHTTRLCELGHYAAMEKQAAAEGKRVAPRARVLTDGDVATIQRILADNFPETDWEHAVDWQTIQAEMERGEYDSPYEQAWEVLISDGAIPYDPRDHLKGARLTAANDAVQSADDDDTFQQDMTSTIATFKRQLRSAAGEPEEADVHARLKSQHRDAYMVARQELDEEAEAFIAPRAPLSKSAPQPVRVEPVDEEKAERLRVWRAIDKLQRTTPNGEHRGVPMEEVAREAGYPEFGEEVDRAAARLMDEGLVDEPILGRFRSLMAPPAEAPVAPAPVAPAPAPIQSASVPVPASQRDPAFVPLGACTFCQRAGAGKLRAWLAQRIDAPSTLVQVCAPCTRSLPEGWSPAGPDFHARMTTPKVADPVPLTVEIVTLPTPANPKAEPTPVLPQVDPTPPVDEEAAWRAAFEAARRCTPRAVKNKPAQAVGCPTCVTEGGSDCFGLEAGRVHPERLAFAKAGHAPAGSGIEWRTENYQPAAGTPEHDLYTVLSRHEAATGSLLRATHRQVHADAGEAPEASPHPAPEGIPEDESMSRSAGARSTDPDAILAFYIPNAGVTRDEAEKAAKLNALPDGTRAGKYVKGPYPYAWKSTLKKDKSGEDRHFWSLSFLRRKPELANALLNPTPEPVELEAAPAPTPASAPEVPQEPASAPKKRAQRKKTSPKADAPPATKEGFAVGGVARVVKPLNPKTIVGNLRAAGAAALAGKPVKITAVLSAPGGRKQYRARAINGVGEYRFAQEWLQGA